MPDTFLPVARAIVARFDLREPEAAAQEISELAEALFGPFDPELAAVWNAAGERKRNYADQSDLLSDAAEASDPLLFLDDFPDARATLHRRMRWRWVSSLRARALGHPPDLRGQTWLSLSEPAREEVREALRELSTFERQHVRRGTPQRAKLDTFLRELAVIYARTTDYPYHEIGLSSHIEGGFIGLAQAILAGLPRREDGTPRVHLTEQTAGALSARWQKIKKHERTGSDP
jgi:hypothetical protein